MRQLRIALIITDLDIGGAERQLVELVVGIDRARFAPIVYCLGSEPSSAEASCVPTLAGAGIEVHCLGGRTIWQFPAVLSCLGRLLRSQSPDVVQTFMFHANVLGRIAARRAGVKTVVSGLRVAERASRWHLRLDRLTQRWVDRYVCVSRSVADFSAERGGLPPEKLVVIPNGIDLAKYPAPPANLADLGITTGRRAVTFVGRLEPQKGVDWLIETAPQWLRRLGDCDLLLVGEGPLRSSLERAAISRGIGDRVHFAGWRPDVPAILAASSLLVLPSAWEGMPNAVLEAMASARPVVATDVEGVRELLGPGAPAQTCPYGDTAALVDRVITLLADAQLAEARGRNNRRRVEEHFSIASTIAAYQDLWESLATN